MIQLLGALLAENVVDTPNGLAFVPLGGYLVPQSYKDTQGDGVHGLPLRGIAVLHLSGDKGEKFTISIAFKTPRHTGSPEDEKEYVLEEGVLSLRIIVDARIPFDGPGLYTARFHLNGKFLVDLSIPVEWDNDAA
jgi:hypothetical protein